MATFQLVVGRQRVEIGHVVAARIQSDEPGGSARFYHSGVSGRLYLAESTGEPGPEIVGIPVLSSSYWPEFWVPGPPLELWAWANVDGLPLTVVLVKP